MIEQLHVIGKYLADSIRPLTDATAYTLTFIAGATHMVHRRSDDHERTKVDWIKLILTITVALGSQLIVGVVAGYLGGQTAIAVHAQRLDDHEKRMDRLDTRVERIIESRVR